MFLQFLKFTGVLSSKKKRKEKKPDWKPMLGFRDILVYKSHPIWPTSVKFLNMWRHSSALPLFCSSVRVGCTASVVPGEDRGSHQPYLWMIPAVFHLVFCIAWVFFVQTLHDGNAVFSSNDHSTITTATVITRHSAEVNVIVPFVNSRLQWRKLGPKTAWKVL